MNRLFISEELVRELDRVLSKPHREITIEEIAALADALERENRWHDMLVALHRRGGDGN